MELYQAMGTQRAVRRLRPDPIPDAVLARVMQAATWAPTGGNVQPWRAIVVSDPEKKCALRDMYAVGWRAYSAAQRAHLEEGADASAIRKTFRAGDYLAAHMHEAPVIVVFCFAPTLMAITDADQPRPTVVGGASVYTAVQNLLLAARAEGLGCVLTTLLCQNEPEVKTLLDVPADWYTAAHVPLGYPVGAGHGPLRRRPVDALFYRNGWKQPL